MRPSCSKGAVWAFLISVSFSPGLGSIAAAYAGDDKVDIVKAVWRAAKQRLNVEGEHARAGATVIVRDAVSDNEVGRTSASGEGEWRFHTTGPDPVPCRVRIEIGDAADEQSISNCVVKKAEFRTYDSKLRVSGAKAPVDALVSIHNFATDELEASTTVDAEGKWRLLERRDPQTVPCNLLVRIVGLTAVIPVSNAPGNCNTGDGDSSAADTVQITINAPLPPSACSSPIEQHCTISVYEGPSTCVGCHEQEAVQMHGSVHYQQSGPTDFVTNITGPAGERGYGAIGINTYCGTHENSPRFTCAGCHVGNGRFPSPTLPAGEAARSEELANVDCLMCHQEVYKRFPDWTDPLGFEPLEMVTANQDGKPDLTLPPIVRKGLKGIPVVDPLTQDFQFLPAGPSNDPDYPLPADAPAAFSPMPITTLEAAQNAHATTRQSCLNCHGGAGGGDGSKRGDISSALIDPPLSVDMHMSRAGEGMVCADCHDAGGHRVQGRGLDLRPNDVAERFSCENSDCHSARPHGDWSNYQLGRRDNHAGRVACQSCHIPTYAKGVPTEVSRDWEKPHFSAKACNGRGGWLPKEIKRSDLTPTYNWFDGTSEVYYLGETLMGNVPTKLLGDGSEAYVLGMPNGDVTSSGAKLHPMKEHLSQLALNLKTNTLVPQSTFEFFRTGSFAAAVKSGLEQTEGMSLYDPYELVQVHTYQTINHGVEVKDHALECGACHGSYSGGPLRMDLQGELGYGLKGPEKDVCTQCHSSKEEKGFEKVHDIHVRDKRKDCSVCHAFSRPERGLSTTIKWEG